MPSPAVSNIVFLGTPDFALPTLSALYEAEGFHISAVITQPDRPAGRGKKLTPPPVKVLAESLGDIDVFQTESLKKDTVLLAHLKGLSPDFFITVAFGQILNKEILAIPTFGTINAHASLLPEFRGANPIQQSILQGKTETGITTMLTERGVDTGPILKHTSLTIDNQDTLGTLSEKLSKAAAPLVIETLRGLLAKTVTPVAQNHDISTHAPKCSKEDAVIQWTEPAQTIQQKIRAFNPAPGATTFFKQDRIKLLSSQCVTTAENSRLENPAVSPGHIIGISESGIQVQTGAGMLEILTLQPAGKKEMPAKDWAKGNLQELFSSKERLVSTIFCFQPEAQATDSASCLI